MGNQPDVPDPAQIARQSEQLAQKQQGLNYESWLSSLINQQGPWGSLTYTQTGTTPEGNPIMTAKTQYEPGIQALFDTLIANKGTAGTQAGALLEGRNYGSANPEDIIGDMSSGITGQVMSQYKASLDPFFLTQKEQLHSSLSNRGLYPGMPAYDNAMRELDTNQGLTMNNMIAQTVPKAMELATGMYKMPAELALSLGGFGAPAAATQDFATNTPSVQPANLIGANANMTQQMMDIWKAQTQQYGDFMGGLGNIGSSVLGGWAGSPSGGAALTSLFALSDARFKRDVMPTGESVNGIPVYTFRYLNDDVLRYGMLAHEVEQVMPDAVASINGVKFVDYGKTLRRY